MGSNVICSIIMSTRFHHKDKKFKRFMHLFDEGFRLFNLTGALVFIPVLKHLPGTTTAMNALKDNRDEMVEFVRYIIKVDSDGSFTGLTIANDQLTLATTDRYQ